MTLNGHDWASHFPAIVEAALKINASSFMIDGEVVIWQAGRFDFAALQDRLRSGPARVQALVLRDARRAHGGDVRDSYGDRDKSGIG